MLVKGVRTGPSDDGDCTRGISLATTVSHDGYDPDGGNNSASASATVTAATPVNPTLTWGTPADIVAGTPLSATQLNATANVPGTFAYTPAAGTLLTAGMGQILTVLFTPDDLTSYTTATAQVSINVTMPPPLVSPVGTPTIDGVLAPGEWNSSGCWQLSLNLPNGGTTPATLCAMNDNTNVYFSLRYDRAVLDPGKSFGLEFDNDNDGVMEEGDDVILHNPDIGFVDDYRTMLPPCSAGDLCAPVDTAGGGTIDGTGAFQHHGPFSVYEMAHPLKSGDSHDFALCGGDTVGFFADVRMIGPGGVWPDDFGDTTWPGWQQYVKLTLGGTCARPAPRADVQVSTTIAPPVIVVGQTVRSTVTVRNVGPDAAPNVTVENVFTPGQQLGGTAGATCVQSFSYVVDCSLGTLAAGSSVTYTVDIVAQLPGLIGNSVQLSHGATDPNYSNNQASAVALAWSRATGSGTSVVDGALGSGEWDKAACLNFYATVPGGGVTPATFCAMNDIANVYLSVRFDRTLVDQPTWISINFDRDRDGLVELGDDWLYLAAGGAFVDGAIQPCAGGGLCGFGDSANGGTTDGAASFQHHLTYSVFEFSHPIASGDTNDIALCPGETVGLYVALGLGSASAPNFPHMPNSADLTLSGECAAQTVPAGQILTTDSEGDGATAADAVETSVTSPAAGSVSIAEAPNAGTPPSGYSFLGNAVQITAPPAPAGQYITIVFRIDASAIPPGTMLGSIQVWRNGVALATCTAPANPLPCASRQLLADGDVELTVYTAQASLWQFLVQDDVTPPSLTCSVTPDILWPPNKAMVPVAVNVALSDAQSGEAGFTLLSVVNDETGTAADTHGFTEGQADLTGSLRADRSGKSKEGRHYTLTYAGSDRAGNTTTCSVVVTVPHDQRK